jgi:hypothetical protein
VRGRPGLCYHTGVNRPDWVQWQRLYETPEHVVAQRLLIVQRLIRDFLATRACDEISVVSICSGQGRTWQASAESRS